MLLRKAVGLSARALAAEWAAEPIRLRLLATSFSNLGCLFRRVGKPHAALRQLEKALEIEKALAEQTCTRAAESPEQLGQTPVSGDLACVGKIQAPTPPQRWQRCLP